MKLYLGAVFLILLKSIVCYYPDETNADCRGMYPKPFVNYAPKGNESAGVYAIRDFDTLKDCVLACCRSGPSCNVVFMHNTTCYHIKCFSDDLCLPLARPDLDDKLTFSVVLVRTKNEVNSWAQYLDSEVLPVAMQRQDILGHLRNDEDFGGSQRYNEGLGSEYLNDEMIGDETGIGLSAENYLLGNQQQSGTTTRSKPAPGNCDSNSDCSHSYEECNSREGKCQCIDGFVRNTTTELCEPTTVPLPSSTTIKPRKQPLIVSAMSKVVQLPESEITLSAFTVPEPLPGDEPYNYEWKLLEHPGNDYGSVADQSNGHLHLIHLKAGLYIFRVTVSNANSLGETLVNVTVLPPKRINKVPIVKITPESQIVRLPTTGAVLDGSGSSDDDGIKSWHWEVHRGPLEYRPHLPDVATLQLTDLTTPGNYTFKLTVTDTDGAANSTTANITVMKVTDYPPMANAGQAAIVYLPNNELTLNGNLSTDDHEITSWEWTKASSDVNKAVDMQQTRTPYLKLSHLQEGDYTFVLKVTDSAGQSNSAEVHVFVKQADHKPPTAHAGLNRTIALPQTWTILEGNAKSKSSQRVMTYHWEVISGPSGAFIENANASKTNVTHLTRGHYVFRLTVLDDTGNAATDTVIVNVTQVRNERPKANAGGDRTIVLPQTLVILNGSNSHDDVGISTWQWTREDISLAIGNILDESDKKPILMLDDLEPGRYVFRLKVLDEDGLSDEDTASVMVKPDPLVMNIVELILGAQARTLTQSQIKGVMQELGFLVRDEATLTIRSIHTERPGGRVVVSLIAHSGDKILPALTVEKILKEKLYRDSSLLRLSVASLRTAICQNNCSNHGVCDEHTRRCLCEAFWMQNLIEKHFGHGEADCEWSVLYVVVGLCMMGLMVAGLVWGMAFFCSKACQRRLRTSTQRPPKYALLDGDEQPNFPNQKLNLSETDDTDSDVLFESSRNNKNGRRELISNGYVQSKNGSSRTNNGFIKMGRRIKT